MERKAWSVTWGRWWVVCWLVVLVAGCLPDEVPVTVTRVTAQPTGVVAEATATTTPTLTASPPAAPTPSTTPSPTPVLTSTPTPIPTMRPFPTVTPPAVYATKMVFMAIGTEGGDGASFHNYLSAPEIVIYTDGQVVWKEGDFLMESTVSAAEMCHLLAQFRDSGFFQEPETIYAFDETTQYSEGAPRYTIQINGPRLGYQAIYQPYVPYLVESVATGFNLLLNYRPADAQPYNPLRLVISIYPVPEEAVTFWGAEPEPWPAELTPLIELRPAPAAYQVPIDGELVATITNVFGSNRLYNDHWYWIEDKLYYLIVRPLLPHETLENFYPAFYAPVPIELPFTCDDPTLLAATPTATSLPPTPTATVEPAISELTGFIAFTSDRDGDEEIYVMNGNGTNVVQLTNHPTRDYLPVWSPDGQKIAFTSFRDGNEEVYVMEVDGTNATRLTQDAGRDWSVDWSPDGQWIVFLSNRLSDPLAIDETWRVYVTRLDGSEQALFNGTGMTLPAWSPDGLSIAYSTHGVIYRSQADGTNEKRLGPGILPAWSPDGERIAFVDRDDLYVMSAAGSDRTRLTTSRDIYSQADWSPDGRFLVFSADQEIQVINVESGQVIQLTNNQFDDDYPVWWA